MLYYVSFSNGLVGVFTSMEKVKELVFDVYKSIEFVVQVYKNSTYVEDVTEDVTEEDIEGSPKESTEEIVVEEVEEDIESPEESPEDVTEDIEESLKDFEESPEESPEESSVVIDIRIPLVWIILYNNEACAYVTDNKKEAQKVLDIFNKTGKVYEDAIEYCELELDVIPESSIIILDSLQRIYAENGIFIDSSKNIVFYA